MKKNGFIMSTYVYILLVFFLLLLGTMLVVLNNTRLLANKIKENTDGNIDFNLVLKGDKEIFIVKDSEYTEPGCIATTFDGEKLEVSVMGEVNAKKSGEYDIEYSAEYKGVEKKVKRKVIVGENLVTYITNLYEDSITRASNNLKKDNTEDKNIRYYGANPNNYVRFNNELWRIIGIFGNNVKLIRNDRLGWLSWDTSESTVNNGYGINQWGESKDTSGNIYEGADLQVYLNKMYYGGDACNDTVERTTTWTGYIGLQYITDYAYASSENDCNTKIDQSSTYKCKNNNWMHYGSTENDATWFMSPLAHPAAAYFVGRVRGDGLVQGGNAPNRFSVFPTIYLKSNILIESGNGTSSNPYILKAGS